MRIKERKAKGKKRAEMEQVHPMGLETERMDRFLCGPNERPAVDRMGRLHFFRKG
jgi:hypothetical protein